MGGCVGREDMIEEKSWASSEGDVSSVERWAVAWVGTAQTRVFKRPNKIYQSILKSSIVEFKNYTNFQFILTFLITIYKKYCNFQCIPLIPLRILQKAYNF